MRQRLQRIPGPVRAASSAVIGVSSYLAAFPLHRAVGGLIGAALFVVSFSVAPIAVGSAIAMVAATDRGSLCSTCGRSRRRHRDVWLCTACDETGMWFP